MTSTSPDFPVALTRSFISLVINGLIHLSGRHAVVLRQTPIGESFVVPDVEVRLPAVVGHEHLAVLKRTHGARIHIYIGIELLEYHAQAALLQEQTNGRRGNAFTQRRNDASRYEYVLHVVRPYRFFRKVRYRPGSV
jgi:hypothetical protein